MSFSITFDTDELRKELRDVGARQMPFALANALNATANDMQAGIRNVVTGRGFVIRSEGSAQFLRRQIKRERGQDFATKQFPVARVRIASSASGRKASLLSLIDQGGSRFSQFAIGSGATFGPSSVVIGFQQGSRRQTMNAIPRGLFPKNTGLQERRNISGAFAKGSLKGKRGTFAVRTGPQSGLVLQRQGGKVRALFAIKPRVRVAARNFFAPMAEKVALGRFDQNLDFALRQALKTAR